MELLQLPVLIYCCQYCINPGSFFKETAYLPHDVIQLFEWKPARQTIGSSGEDQLPFSLNGQHSVFFHQCFNSENAGTFEKLGVYKEIYPGIFKGGVE